MTSFLDPLRAAKATAAYEQVGLETGVASASPHKLVLMLFDGALAAIAVARGHMTQGEIPEKGMAISKAISIISSGLHQCLDYESGGELADRLGALYDYMARRLVSANAQNSTAALDEVTGLLNEIRSAWAEIADQVEPGLANDAADIAR